MKLRRASSLIELLIIMSACSVVLTLSAALLHRSMHVHSRSRVFVDAERRAARLSHKFREDVHKALAHRVGGTVGADDGFLQLTHSADEAVQYALVGGTVSRSLIREGRTLAREEYSFPTAVKVEVQQHDAPTRLVLAMVAEPANALNRSGRTRIEPSLSPVSLQADAVLGRDLRFLLRSGEEEVQQ